MVSAQLLVPEYRRYRLFTVRMQFHAMMVVQLRNQNLHAVKIQNWIAIIVLLLFLILKAKITEISIAHFKHRNLAKLFSRNNEKSHLWLFDDLANRK